MTPTESALHLEIDALKAENHRLKCDVVKWQECYETLAADYERDMMERHAGKWWNGERWAEVDPAELNLIKGMRSHVNWWPRTVYFSGPVMLHYLDKAEEELSGYVILKRPDSMEGENNGVEDQEAR